MQKTYESFEAPVTLIGSGRRIETERDWRDRVQVRFALYCTGTIVTGFCIGIFLGVLTNQFSSGPVIAAAPSYAPEARLLQFARVSLVESTQTTFAPKPSVTISELPPLVEPVPSAPTARPATGPEIQRGIQIQQVRTEDVVREISVEMTGRRPQLWLKHAVPTRFDRSLPQIAIVIDDLGPDEAATKRAIELPGPLTLSFLPYAPNVSEQAAEARDAGHELLVHVPMEADGPLSPGPHALLVDQSEADRARHLEWALSRFSGFVGINNHMGSRFTRAGPALDTVMVRLVEDGFLFLDSRTSINSVALSRARTHGVTATARDVFLDHEPNTLSVLANLQKLEEIAVADGSAIAIGHPHDVTLEILTFWLSSAAQRGFAVVPLTAVVKTRMAPPLELASAG